MSLGRAGQVRGSSLSNGEEPLITTVIFCSFPLHLTQATRAQRLFQFRHAGALYRQRQLGQRCIGHVMRHLLYHVRFALGQGTTQLIEEVGANHVVDACLCQARKRFMYGGHVCTETLAVLCVSLPYASVVGADAFKDVYQCSHQLSGGFALFALALVAATANVEHISTYRAADCVMLSFIPVPISTGISAVKSALACSARHPRWTHQAGGAAHLAQLRVSSCFYYWFPS